jgi:hypothetical protein
VESLFYDSRAGTTSATRNPRPAGSADIPIVFEIFGMIAADLTTAAGE